MRNQERSSYHASLLALDCGLGKTLTTLLFISQMNEEKRRYNLKYPEKARPYRASLVVVPGPTVEIWQQDAARFYPNGLTIKQYYGTASNVSASRVSSLIENTKLNDFLDSLDPSDYKVGLAVSIRQGVYRC